MNILAFSVVKQDSYALYILNEHDNRVIKVHVKSEEFTWKIVENRLIEQIKPIAFNDTTMALETFEYQRISEE